MKRLLVLLLALLAATPAFAQSPAQAQAVVQTENVRAELLADASAIKPGEPFWVGLRQTIRPKWHTYWKNPGDSGLPTEITWKLPEGAKADPIVWPRPHLFDLSGVINYGFKVEATLLVRITPPANASGNFKLAADANWLVCEDVCIPEDGKFELTLPVTATGAPAPPATRAIFLRTSFIDRQCAAFRLGAVEARDRGLGLLIAAHLDEAEALRATSVAVHNHLGRLHGAIRAEKLLQIAVADAVSQVAYV